MIFVETKRSIIKAVTYSMLYKCAGLYTKTKKTDRSLARNSFQIGSNTNLGILRAASAPGLNMVPQSENTSTKVKN